MTTRREFLGTSAALLAARYAHVLPRQGRLPLGFSTLGCPQWTWPQILDFAAGHGYAAVELRGIQTNMDLTKVPELSPERLAESKRQLAARGLAVSCLGASAHMHEMDPIKHAATVLIESHGDFTDSPTLLEILQQADSPAVALLWDAHHTFVSGKEEPEDTVRHLGRYIRHTHLKDSIPAGNDRRYVLTGTGQVPVKRQIEALVKIGYRGYFSFEWEKRWHPEIEEPEVAFAQFVEVAGGYLRGAGAR